MTKAPPAIAMTSLDRRERLDGVTRADLGEVVDRFALREALSFDEDASVRACAADRLGRADDDATEHALLDALGDAAPSVREAALSALGRRGTRSVVARAQRAIAGEPVWWVRRAATYALGAAAGSSAMEPLLRALEDPVWRVRHAALRVLTALGEDDGAARAALVGPIDAATPAREAHAFLSERLGAQGTSAPSVTASGSAPALVIDAPSDPDPAVVTALLLERAGPVDAGWLVEHLGHPHAPLRDEIVRRLAEADVDTLERALDACDDVRRPYRAEALWEVLERAPKRRRELAARVIALGSGARPHALVWALGETGDRRAASAFLGAADEDVRAAALATMAAGRPREGVEEALVSALDDLSDAVRAVAAGELARRGSAALAGVDWTSYDTAIAASGVGATRDVAALARAAVDARAPVRAAAIEALARAGALGDDDRSRAALGDDPWVARAALDEATAPEVLARRAVPALHRVAVGIIASRGDVATRRGAAAFAARSLDPWVRARAPELAGDDAGDDAWRALLDLSRDVDLGVRAAAASAIEDRSTPRLEELLAGGALTDAQRAAAYAVLTRAFDEGAQAMVARALAGEEPAIVREQLLGIARAWGDAPARAEIVERPPRPVRPVRDVGRRVLGRTGIAVAPLGISGAHELEVAALARAREAGVNLFFWEPRYVELGKFLRRCRRARDEIVVVAGTYDADARSIERDVDRARRRLGVDHVDVFLAFWARSPARLRGAGVDALARLKERGAIRAMGFSTHDRALAEGALDDARWDVVMTRHSAAHPGAEARLFARAERAGAGVITFSNLCYGRLLRGRDGAPGPSARDAYRYSLAQRGVSACICAPRRVRELVEDLGVLDAPPMSEVELAALRAHGAWVHEEDTRWSALVRRGGRPAEEARREVLSLLEASREEPRDAP